MTSSGRDRIRMTGTEVEHFLAGARKVQVATIGVDGAPHLTTLFYVLRDGHITFWTYGRSQKIANLRRDPRISCLVEDGEDYFDLRGVSIRGRAELVTDEARVREIGTAVATRMVDGADLGELGRDEVERQVPKRVGVVVVPEHTASWDHRKLLAGHA
ncbi:MAG TPA: TIGR03618 family F420-dependent PPOX class oxidoreductase [Nocardioidaceae bacterium]